MAVVLILILVLVLAVAVIVLDGDRGRTARRTAAEESAAEEAAAEAEALANNWAVSIAIVDDGGHLLWQQRLDGAPPVSSYIAPAKANTAALGRRESKIYEDVVNNGRVSFLSAPKLEGMLEGGVPVIADGGTVELDAAQLEELHDLDS